MDQLSLISVQERLSRLRMRIFTVRDFARVLRIHPKTAKAFLSYHSESNVFPRIKRGLYILGPDPPSKFEIANYLYKPSYISFETALSYYGMIPENVYTITCATTKAYREFNFQNQIYQYRRIKKSLFFGYQPIKQRDRTVFIADREKVFLDYLYYSIIKKRQISERLDLSKINKNQLGKHINYFKRGIRKNKALIKLVKEMRL